MAILYLLPTLSVLAGWYMLLFLPTGSAATPASTLRYVLVEDPRRLWFYWLLALPVLWIALSFAYLTPAARRRSGAIVLFGLGTLMAVATWLTLTFDIALFASIPLVYGVMSVREALALHSSTSSP